ncbi:MAG: hypothetical protein LBL52_00170 [Rickettsiales bacterium]|jgi:hypothetical protein|nr:hypothetical protein [Rickettsiales bacterium]
MKKLLLLCMVVFAWPVRAVECLSGDCVCEACPAGFYAKGGDVECTPCPRGTWSDTPTAGSVSVCQQCPPGYLGLNEGANSPAACGTCDNGKVPNSDQSACENCQLGWTAVAGDPVCTKCPKGSYGKMDVNNRPICERCPAGTMTAEEGMVGADKCGPCAAGYYSNEDTNGLCIACPVGTYSYTQSSANCYACPIDPNGGYATNQAPGSASCTCSGGTRWTTGP